VVGTANFQGKGPAQSVDATPSNQLIGQDFTPERRSVWLYSIRPIQSSVFFESALATDFRPENSCK
jgi:hypothetical protein